MYVDSVYDISDICVSVCQNSHEYVVSTKNRVLGSL